MQKTLNRLEVLEEEMEYAWCIKHTEILKEVHNIAVDAMNHNKTEVLDKIMKILDNVKKYDNV